MNILEDVPLPTGVFGVLSGPLPGPRVVIVGSTHGDEPCGTNAILGVLQKLSLMRGTAVFVQGNPRAYEQKVRFTEANLNRMFKKDEDIPEEKKRTYEYARARELMPLYTSADALLDIHSSESAEAPPFVICTERSRSVAAHMPFPILSWGWDVIEPGGSDDLMDRYGKIGIGIECGYDNDPLANDRAKGAVYSFLSSFSLIDPVEEMEKPTRFVHAVYAHMPRVDFVPSRVFADFEEVKKDEVIGYDGGFPMKAVEDGCVLFVRNRKAPGQEAYIFALEKERPTPEALS